MIPVTGDLSALEEPAIIGERVLLSDCEAAFHNRAFSPDIPAGFPAGAYLSGENWPDTVVCWLESDRYPQTSYPWQNAYSCSGTFAQPGSADNIPVYRECMHFHGTRSAAGPGKISWEFLKEERDNHRFLTDGRCGRNQCCSGYIRNS